jgi:hypothetical protein
MTVQTNPTPDALVERVARAVAEAWRNDALPSDPYSPEEVDWQDWLPEARAALDATPLAAMQERIESLEAENEKLRAAISWIEPPFVDGNTLLNELRKRVQFCVADAKRAALGRGE